MEDDVEMRDFSGRFGRAVATDDKALGRELLKRATGDAITSAEFMCAATAWWFLHHDEGELVATLRRMTTDSVDAEAWCMRWQTLVNLLGLAAAAPHCTDVLSDATENEVADILPGIIRDMALQRVGDERLADRVRLEEFIRLSEKRCVYLEDWHSRLLAWQYLGTAGGHATEADFLRCMERMQKLARTSGDWHWCALAWSCFEKPRSAEIVLCWKRELMAATSWNTMLDPARELCEAPHTDATDKCIALKILESRATTAAHWDDCAALWSTMGQPENAERCKRKAASMASQSGEK